MTSPTFRPQQRKLIGLTDLAWSIAEQHVQAGGYDSPSDWLEWVVLCQQFPRAEALALYQQRRRRGGLGIVQVIPDDVELPPEG